MLLPISATGSATDPDEADDYLRQFDEEDVLRFLKEPNTQREVRNLAFAYFTPDEFPTHRMLQELMLLDSDARHGQIMEIATLSCRGVATATTAACSTARAISRSPAKSRTSSWATFPKSAKELRAAAGFLITNHARKHIMTLPRAIAETERL